MARTAAPRLLTLLTLIASIAGACCAAEEDLSITVLTPSIPAAGGTGWLQAAVTDASGAAVKGATVTLQTAAGVGGELASNVQLWQNDDGTYGLDFGALHPRLGLYTLSLAAQQGSRAGTAVADIAYVGAVEVIDTIVSVEGSGSTDKYPVAHPQALTETLSLATGSNTKAVVTFTVRQANGGESVKPHQAFVSVTLAGSPQTAAFFRARHSDEGVHRATFSPADINTQTEGQGGTYDLTLLVGDAGIESPLKWQLGQISVPAQKAAAAVLVPGAAKPEIKHQFRAPDKTAPAIVSLLFAGLQVAALLGLLFVLGSSGLLSSISNGLPRSASGRIAALAFHGGVTALLGLYLVFWVRLSILSLLPPLTLWGLVTATAGYFLLSDLASSQVKVV